MKALRRSFYLLTAALLLTAFSTSANAGTNSTASYEMNPAVSMYADMLPQPVGGYEALASKVDYPEVALNANVEGEVLAKVTVGRDGNVEDVKLLKTAGAGCDEAVTKAIKDTKFTYNVSEGSPFLSQISILFKFNRHSS